MFGKNPQGLGGMPTFGAPTISQQLVSAGRRAQYDRKEFHWKGTYKLPVSPGPPDIGRLIAGSYHQQWLDDDNNLQEGDLPFVMYKEHHGGKGRGSCICAAGVYFSVREKRLPCPSCDVFWQDYAIRNMKKANGDKTPGPERIGVRNYFAFNWYDYGMYYQVPEVDRRTGQVRVSKKTGQPYVEWVKGAPGDPRFHGYAFKWGHLLPWCVPSSYKDELDTYTKMIANGCVSCGSRDSIVTITRNCGNPACRAVIYDASSTLTPEQKALIDYNPFQCSSCGQKMFTVEQIQCRNCQSPKRASIFDVDLQVMRSSSQKGTAHLHIVNYSEPRVIQIPPEAAAQLQPLDLLTKFSPTPPDEQNRIMGLGAMQQNLAQPGYMGMQAQYGVQGMQPPPMMGMQQQPMQQPQYPQQPPMQAPPGMAWQQPPQQVQPPQWQHPPFPPSPAQYPPQLPPQQVQQPQMPQMQYPQQPQQAYGWPGQQQVPQMQQPSMAPPQGFAPPMQGPAFPTMGQPMQQPQQPAVPYDDEPEAPDDQPENNE